MPPRLGAYQHAWTLPDQHHLVGSVEVVGADAIEVNAAGNMVAADICTIPRDSVMTGGFVRVDQCRYRLTEDIKDIHSDAGRLWQAEIYERNRIERVGVVLRKLETIRHRWAGFDM